MFGSNGNDPQYLGLNSRRSGQKSLSTLEFIPPRDVCMDRAVTTERVWLEGCVLKIERSRDGVVSRLELFDGTAFAILKGERMNGGFVVNDRRLRVRKVRIYRKWKTLMRFVHALACEADNGR